MSMLTLCGAGIKTLAHVTEEMLAALETADQVLYLVNEPLCERWIQQRAKQAESLVDLYFSSPDRRTSYEAITHKILTVLETVEHLCVVFYGHPCVFANPGLLAVHHVLTTTQHDAIILPGISAMDCLFADLAIDPGVPGCQFVEATDLLIYERKLNPELHLLIWQIATLGQLGHASCEDALLSKQRYTRCYEHLRRWYPKTHPMVIYEASLYPTIAPVIRNHQLQDLIAQPEMTTLSTLYLPPLETTRRPAKAMQDLLFT